MKRSNGKRLTFTFIFITGLILAGCASAGRTGYPYENGQKFLKEEVPSPEDHTLIFGHLGTNFFASKGIFTSLEFAQIDPQYEAKRIYPGVNSTMFYLTPVKPGPTFKIIYWLVKNRWVTMYSFPGLRKDNPNLSFTAKKPGLQYVGSYFFQVNKQYKTLKNAEYDFVEHESPGELEALQLLLPRLTETAWQPVIEQRIKELTNE